MKKIIAFTLLTLLFALPEAYGQTYAKSSGLRSASAIIHPTTIGLTGALIITDGTNAATLICYEGKTTVGKTLFKGTVAGTSNFGGATYEIPIQSQNGLYCAISGTGAAYIIYTK